ncbi:sortase [Candidatus Dojkabacteria bacterium]|nr:sortase [Candidatus Dojkabacteria bacterium]
MVNNHNTTVTDQSLDENEEYIRMQKARQAKYLVSFLLAITGFIVLGAQLGPLASSYVKGKIIEKGLESIKDPTTESELSPEDADLPYYDPGLSYFQNLVQHISPGYVAGASTDPNHPQPTQNITVDENYSKDMKMSIPSIGISDVTITSNVDSFNESVYNKALKRGLAHFKGTPLPGDGGNSFIYGHSAVESFFSRHPNYEETIFSRLENIEIADTFMIKKDGKTLEYTVQKKKIADPDNFDVISGIEGKQTVTLMTCWPLGIGSQRLIVIGELTNDG